MRFLADPGQGTLTGVLLGGTAIGVEFGRASTVRISLVLAPTVPALCPPALAVLTAVLGAIAFCATRRQRIGHGEWVRRRALLRTAGWLLSNLADLAEGGLLGLASHLSSESE